MTTYRTITGDTWDGIAFKLSGAEANMTALIQANLDYAEYVIFPAGITLNVPTFEINESDTLPPWLQGGESI
ncbi:hypothetical protein D3C76_1832150 [compost metagenome]